MRTKLPTTVSYYNKYKNKRGKPIIGCHVYCVYNPVKMDATCLSEDSIRPMQMQDFCMLLSIQRLFP